MIFTYFCSRFTVSTAYRDTDGALPSRVQLPTAPRSAQPVNLDSSQLPDKPPYTVYLGNIPFDISEEDIIKFLKQCQVSSFCLYSMIFGDTINLEMMLNLEIKGVGGGGGEQFVV